MKNILVVIGFILGLIVVGFMVLKYPPNTIPQFDDTELEFIQNEEGLK